MSVSEAAPAKVQICKTCVLPSTFPGITFNEDGICSVCQREQAAEDPALLRKRLLGELEELFDSVRGKASEYDCVVAYSGGKDSSYTLMALAQTYRLRLLAITVDNGFLSDRAIENCRTVAAALSVDHIFFAPDQNFMTRMYRRSLEDTPHSVSARTRASDVCNSCIGLINNVMVKFALRFDVPIIAGGYIGGQVPKDAALVRLDSNRLRSMRNMTTKRMVDSFGSDAERYFSIGQDDSDRVIALINPLLAMEYHEDAIVETLATFGWERPTDTGAMSSNCTLNDLGIAVHERRYGFNPYVAEMADLVRKGFLDRDAALAKLAKHPPPEALKAVAEQIDFSLSDVGL